MNLLKSLAGVKFANLIENVYQIGTRCEVQENVPEITKVNSAGVSELDQYFNLETLGTASNAKPEKIIKWFT